MCALPLPDMRLSRRAVNQVPACHQGPPVHRCGAAPLNFGVLSHLFGEHSSVRMPIRGRVSWREDQVPKRAVVTGKFHQHLAWGSASLAFGLFLIYFGNSRHVFSADGWRFPAVIFGISWLIVVELLRRYFRDNPPVRPGGR